MRRLRNLFALDFIVVLDGASWFDLLDDDKDDGFAALPRSVEPATSVINPSRKPNECRIGREGTSVDTIQRSVQEETCIGQSPQIEAWEGGDTKAVGAINRTRC